MAVNDASSVAESFGAGRAVPASKPSTPRASYDCSHRFTEPPVTSSSAASSATRRCPMYPSTARPRRHASRSPGAFADTMNARNFNCALALRRPGLDRSRPRPCHDHLRSDRGTIISSRSGFSRRAIPRPATPLRIAHRECAGSKRRHHPQSLVSPRVDLRPTLRVAAIRSGLRTP